MRLFVVESVELSLLRFYLAQSGLFMARYGPPRKRDVENINGCNSIV